jgi:transcription initiation factor TFIIB
LVVEADRITRSVERREDHTDAGQVARTSAPSTVTLHDRGLGGKMGWASDTSLDQRRQRRLDGRAWMGSAVDRNLAYALGEIHRITAALDLPDIVDERASRFAREMQAAEVYVGDDLDAGAAAAVYTACRCLEIVRAAEDIATVARTEADDVIRLYRKTRVTLGLAPPLIMPTDWIPQLVDQVDLGRWHHQQAMRWARRAEANAIEFGGAAPSGIAAACVYFAGEAILTQADVAAAANVSPPTIRARVEDLEALEEE